MKIIATGTLKGGAGKTTTLFNIAAILAEKYRVCAIDLDPQCNLSGACGIRHSAYWRQLIKGQAVNIMPSSRDIFVDGNAYGPDDLIVKSPIKELPNLDLIPGNILMTAVELTMVNRSAREYVLRNYIDDHMDVFGQYDYIFLDTNPSVGVINQNGFVAADSIIMVSDVGQDGLDGAGNFLYLWGSICKALRMENNIKALILDRCDRRTVLTKQIYNFCKRDEFFKDLVVDALIYEKVSFKKARLSRLPVNCTEDGMEAAVNIRDVVNELFKRGVF